MVFDKFYYLQILELVDQTIAPVYPFPFEMTQTPSTGVLNSNSGVLKWEKRELPRGSWTRRAPLHPVSVGCGDSGVGLEKQRN